MNHFQIGDVVEVQSEADSWFTAEVISVCGTAYLICDTETYPCRFKWEQANNLRNWQIDGVAKETKYRGFAMPVENFERVNSILENALRGEPSVSLLIDILKTNGLTFDHVVHLCFVCAPQNQAQSELVFSFCANIVHFSILYLTHAVPNLPLLKHALRLTSQVLTHAPKFLHWNKNNSTPGQSSVPIYEDFLSSGGVEMCVRLVFLLEELSVTDQNYISAIANIPIFHTHGILKQEIYERFTIPVIARYQHFRNGILENPTLKLKFLDELDYCLTTYGLKENLNFETAYALKNTQISICAELVQSKGTGCYAHVEFFSALLKANCRDKGFQRILRRFDFSSKLVTEAVSRLPEHNKFAFSLMCILGNFSVESVFSQIENERVWMDKHLTEEFFEDLLKYRSTDFLLKVSQSTVDYIKSRFQNVSERLIENGADFDVLDKFYPGYQLTPELCVKLANSVYSDMEKGQLLQKHFRDIQELAAVLDAPVLRKNNEKGVLLACYFNVKILHLLWVRGKSKWSRVPAGLFVTIFRDDSL